MIIVGISPLSISSTKVREAINLFPVLKTLVAPIFPEPIFVKSPYPLNFVKTIPNGIEPER